MGDKGQRQCGRRGDGARPVLLPGGLRGAVVVPDHRRQGAGGTFPREWHVCEGEEDAAGEPSSFSTSSLCLFDLLTPADLSWFCPFCVHCIIK